MPAILWRSSSEASTARCSSTSRWLWALVILFSSRHKMGSSSDDQEEQAGDGDAGEPAPQLAGALGHLPVGRVSLEEQRLPGRRPDRPVYLEQLAAAPLVPVLRPLQVGYFRVHDRPGERCPLLASQRERLADQPRLVGVDDAPGGGPQLDPDYGRAEDLLPDNPVDGASAPLGYQRSGRP